MGTIRKFDLQDLINTYNITTFVETGTFMGDSVDYALTFNFKRVISIEINAELVRLAKLKYKDVPKVEILQGNSFEVIKTLLPTLGDNCLFWLDAHFPGAEFKAAAYDSEKNMDVRLPLEKELSLIYAERKKFTDVIIADDLWLYEDDDKVECGTLEYHFRRCGIRGEQGNELKRSDLVTNRNLDFIRNDMSDKYTLKKYYTDQGYIVLLPIQ